jgi:hypothetical protein
LIEQRDYDIIFKELNSIRLVNKTFLSQLELRFAEDKQNKKPTQTLGEIFFKFAPIFKSYASYCNNYDNVDSKIRELQKNKQFSEFLKTQRTSKPARGYDLLSLLIMPIQRIPRYNLLLKELLSNTSKLHRDYEYLQKGLDAIKSTADYVNQRMKDFENQLRVTEISNLIGMNFVKTSRNFRIQGAVKVYVNAVWEDRYCFVFNDTLVFCEKPKKDDYRYVYQLDFDASPFSWLLDIKDQGDFVNSYHLVHDKETLIFSHETAELKKKWMAALELILDDLLTRNTKNHDWKTNRAVLRPQKGPLEKRRLSIFKSDTKVEYPKERKDLVVIEDLSKKKQVGLARVTVSHKDKLFPDEISCMEGDILVVYDKIKNTGMDWNICQKLGFNCSFAAIITQHKDFFDLYQAEKKKKITNVMNSFTLVDPPKLLLPRKIDVYDSNFFDGLVNTYSERDQIGIIPTKSLVMLPDDAVAKMMEVKVKRDEKEDLKIRNFKVVPKK